MSCDRDVLLRISCKRTYYISQCWFRILPDCRRVECKEYITVHGYFYTVEIFNKLLEIGETVFHLIHSVRKGLNHVLIVADSAFMILNSAVKVIDSDRKSTRLNSSHVAI